MIKKAFIFLLIISIFVIWDIYPLFLDYEFRYLLKTSIQKYKLLTYDFNNLDKIVHQTGDFEGHIGCSKYKIQFINNILDKYPINTVAEIGFNAGHSSIIFLNHPKNIDNVKSFDLCNHKYSQKTQKYIKNKFKKR